MIKDTGVSISEVKHMIKSYRLILKEIDEWPEWKKEYYKSLYVREPKITLKEK